MNSTDKKKPDHQNKILVVEDSKITITAISNLLAKMNCKVDVASEGQLALKLAKENQYDLIFMDIGLPDIDGYEITKNIRAIEGVNKTVPIVGLTAYVDENSKIRCINIGMNDIVTKPLSTEQAEEILTTLIPNRSSSIKLNNYDVFVKREEYALLPLFDFEAVLHQFHEEDIAKDMLMLFFRALPKTRQEIKAANDKNDREDVLKMVHKLKGEASYCSLRRLNQACLDLEMAIKTNNEIAYRTLYGLMFQIINATLEVLKVNIKK